jgi:hypothetical protein
MDELFQLPIETAGQTARRREFIKMGNIVYHLHGSAYVPMEREDGTFLGDDLVRYYCPICGRYFTRVEGQVV